jgi:hypothetical protein
MARTIFVTKQYVTDKINTETSQRITGDAAIDKSINTQATKISDNAITLASVNAKITAETSTRQTQVGNMSFNSSLVNADSSAVSNLTEAVNATISLKWEEVSTELYNDEKLKCSDGSDYKFYFKKGSENLLIFFSGGGACWDYDTCNSHNKSYPIKTYENKTDLKYNKPGHWKGLLDLDNSNNPIKDWSILFLPYCSADLHIGNKIKYYSKENRKIKIYHNGYNNINFALNWMKKNKIDSFNKTIVSGSSSGGYGAMFNFSLIKKKINSKSDNKRK